MTKETSLGQTLLQTLGQKEIGNYFEVSSFAKQQDGIFKTVFHRLGKELLDFTINSGMKYIPESAQVFLRSPDFFGPASISDPMQDRTTIGGKLRTVYDADPKSFIIFAAHFIEQMRQERDIQKNSAESARKELDNVVGIVYKSWTLWGARRKIRTGSHT